MANSVDPTILKQSKYADKIELIAGIWDWEHEQRNACLKKAKEDGFDYLLVHDADEYYSYADYSRILQQISENPDHDFYATPWCTFWKSWDYILINEHHSIVHGYPNIAMNCKRDVWFSSLRNPTYGSKAFYLDALCYHGSYVLNDQEVYRKISSWGHAQDFDRDAWYQNKWLRWEEAIEDLHPTHPQVWKKAVKYNGILPEVLRSIDTAHAAPSPEVKPAINRKIPDWLRLISGLEGWLSPAEQFGLLHLPALSADNEGAIVEIGSYKGKSTACLAVGSQLFTRSKPTVYAIDPLLDTCYEDFHRNMRSLGLHEAVRSIRKLSTEAYEDCPDTIALLFIDGDHSYIGVKHDIEHYTVRLAPGGIVAFHDYTHSPEVKRAVDEMCASDDFELIADYDSLRTVRRKA